MTFEPPSAEEYSSQRARSAAMTVVDIRAKQAHVTDAYNNEMLLDINNDCMQLAVSKDSIVGTINRISTSFISLSQSQLLICLKMAHR
jgi:hypothetical protein